MTEPRYMHLRGDGLNVNRYRADEEGKYVHLYLDVRGEYTVAELLDFLASHEVKPEDVTFRGGCFVLTQLATEQDRAKWQQVKKAQEARALKSRREWYERLRAEFECE